MSNDPSQGSSGLPPAPVPQRGLNTKEMFAALRYPNYRLWFYGQTASLMGTWMQTTAQGFLIYQLTQSAAYLGYIGFAAGIPSWLFMLFGGVISDRMPRRKLLVITQVAMMLLAFALGLLTLSGLVQPWHIILLAFLLGVANAFDAPARQSFTLEMVDREDLTNAIALNAAMFNTGTAVGPAIAGLFYVWFGPGWCFLINGISFLFVIAALLKMKLRPFVRPEKYTSPMYDLREGLRYVAAHKIIRSIILVVGVFTLLGWSFGTLVPEWAVNVLKGDATTNGLLQSLRGVGALMGALFIAALGRNIHRGKWVTAATFAFPVLLAIFAFVRWLPLSLVILMAVGWSTITLMNLCNALVQSQVSDQLRGRVMGIYTLVFMGIMPIGALMFGFLADSVGSPVTLWITSGLLLTFGVVVWFAIPKLRQLK